MSDIPSFAYDLLWEERQLVSVANLTRQDGLDFLRLVPEIGVVTKVTRYPLLKANEALADLRAGRFEGAAVLIPELRLHQLGQEAAWHPAARKKSSTRR